MRRRWFRCALCLAVLSGIVRADTADAGNLSARRYGLYQYDRPWYTRGPGHYLSPYRPWYTLPYRYLYQSFGYNLPDPWVGTWPPLFVPADELIGYPFLDYDTAPCPTAAGPRIFDEPVEAPLLDEWPLLEWEPAVLEEDLLDGCYYW